MPTMNAAILFVRCRAMFCHYQRLSATDPSNPKPAVYVSADDVAES